MTSEDNKRIAKNALFLYIRMFFVMLVSFYTSRVVLSSLGVVDYGVYSVVGGIVGALAILTSAMATSTQRWITVALGRGDEENLKRTFAVSMTAQGIIALLLFLLIETVGLWYLSTYAVIPTERMNAATFVFQLSAATSVLSVLNVPFQGAILAHEKMGAFALFSIIDVVMKLVICFALPVTQMDKLMLYSVLLFFAFAVNLFCVWTYCRRKFAEVRFHFLWDKAMIKAMWGVAFWNVTGKIAFISYSQGLTLLTNIFFGPAMNAASTISSQATNYLNQLGSNFQTAINPQITKNYACSNYPEVEKLVFRGIKFPYFLMLFLAVPLFCEADILLRFWLGNVPDHALLFTRLAIFVTLIAIINNPLNTAAVANGNIRSFQLYTNSIQILILPTTYVVYKVGGIPESSTIMFIIFFFLSTLMSVWILRRLVHLSFRHFITDVLFVLFRVTALSFAFPVLVCYALPESWRRFTTVLLLSLTTTALTIYTCGLRQNERLFLKNFVTQKIAQWRNR